MALEILDNRNPDGDYLAARAYLEGVRRLLPSHLVLELCTLADISRTLATNRPNKAVRVRLDLDGDGSEENVDRLVRSYDDGNFQMKMWAITRASSDGRPQSLIFLDPWKLFSDNAGITVMVRDIANPKPAEYAAIRMIIRPEHGFGQNAMEFCRELVPSNSAGGGCFPTLLVLAGLTAGGACFAASPTGVRDSPSPGNHTVLPGGQVTQTFAVSPNSSGPHIPADVIMSWVLCAEPQIQREVAASPEFSPELSPLRSAHEVCLACARAGMLDEANKFVEWLVRCLNYYSRDTRVAQ